MYKSKKSTLIMYKYSFDFMYIILIKFELYKLAFRELII